MFLCGAGVGINTSSMSNADYMSAVINLLPDDKATTNITNDHLLTTFGQIIGTEWAANIRCHSQYLARLKMQLSVPGGYDSILKAEHFDGILTATNELCEISSEKTLNGCLKLEKPHIALKVGQVLRKITHVCNDRDTLLNYNRLKHCHRSI